MTMSKEIAIHCDSKIRETDCQEYEDSDDENIDVGSNYNESMSDNEPDIELTREEAVVIKKVGVRSFGIDDILNHTNSKDVTEQRHKTLELRSPLDALFSLTTSFESMKQKSDKLQLRKEVCSKKKRKSRTAFTNHQIFELEKRFLYQKYLSPADRDEISSTLGLSGGQVITWFQNRRAKFKRDIEEMKKDVEKGGGGGVGGHPQPPPKPSPTAQQIISDNISRLQQPASPLPLHSIHRPHLPPLPHPFPLLALAPHLMYPFQRQPGPLSPQSRSRSPSPPSRSHGRVGAVPQIKVEKTSP